ncbi:anti-sigma factor [Nocardia farcinica]|nr:anti-sigma factor [Nocardia farcinica]MBF6247481.1 anti-sigma factor [Nocardia elegans]PEH75682.1 anti-sigma factor [Nocardia sp. FDAARGOS_372]MBA4854509.1 anti-sigma factor [Nocardia farcinica]MBC9814694.1 anti-sigma factor [Nocardia farcinica]
MVMGMGERIGRSSTGTTSIGIRVPARPDQLTMLRALAETVALIADFAIDEVTDIRLALDEVATALVLDAAPESILECEFSYAADCMHVRVRGVALSDAVVSQAGFGWHIVRTLTESIAAVQEPYDGRIGGYRTTIDFRWTRELVDGS